MKTSKIAPCLWFNGEAEDAANFYVSLFPESRIENISRYDESTRLPVSFPHGTALMVEFTLAGQRFQALNGGPQFRHSEAMSLSISCQDAREVDRYWQVLTENGGTEGPCGWLKDRFGVSWQIVPAGLATLMTDPDPGRRNRALQAMLKMKKSMWPRCVPRPIAADLDQHLQTASGARGGGHTLKRKCMTSPSCTR